MSFTTTWRPLCKVNIWHGYYLHPGDRADNSLTTAEQNAISNNVQSLAGYNILNDVTIAADTHSKKLMSGYKVIFRTSPFGFGLWLQAVANTTGTFSPFIPFSGRVKLTFYVCIKQPAFLNFTNLPLRRTFEYLYYFSNRANNSVESTHYLNATGAYASDGDRVLVRQQRFLLDVSSLGLAEIRFVLENDLNRDENLCRSTNLLESCELDWSKLPAGLYTLSAFDSTDTEIPSLRDEFYLNTGEVPVACLAVIEIFHLPDVNFHDYALLDTSDNSVLLQPDYTLWWQNRLTLWRYIFNHSQTVAPDPASDVIFTDAEQRQLVTRDMHPLIAKFRAIRFQQDIPGTEINEEILLPNPAVDSLYPESGTLFSDVYLGNFDLNRA